MRSTLVGLYTLVGLAAATTIGSAGAAPLRATGALAPAADAVSVVADAQFVWGGYRYCWYDDGWRGAGWYRCGFSWRQGLGWGGPLGWHGWDRRRFREGRFDRDRRYDGRRGQEFRQSGPSQDFRDGRSGVREGRTGQGMRQGERFYGDGGRPGAAVRRGQGGGELGVSSGSGARGEFGGRSVPSGPAGSGAVGPRGGMSGAGAGGASGAGGTTGAGGMGGAGPSGAGGGGAGGR